MTKEEYQQKIDNMFPKQHIQVINFNGILKPVVLRCGLCNSIFNMRADHIYKTHKDYLWIKCCQSKSQKLKEQCLAVKSNDIKIVSFSKYKQQRKITYQCLHCGKNTTKTLGEFLKNHTCYYCNRYTGKKSHEQFEQDLIGRGITALEQYDGAYNPIKFKCNSCGFIWKTKPHTILNGCGCPRCNRFSSKGEKRIADILTKMGIYFEPQKKFDWQSNSRSRYDFYIPSYNLILEFHGRQHYEEIDYFQESLQHRQSLDAIKKKEAKSHNIKVVEIPY